MIIITQEDDVLDELLVRNLGSSASISAVLANNPVLATYGAHLPANLSIEIPEIAETTKNKEKKVVALWD